AMGRTHALELGCTNRRASGASRIICGLPATLTVGTLNFGANQKAHAIFLMIRNRPRRLDLRSGCALRRSLIGLPVFSPESAKKIVQRTECGRTNEMNEWPKLET
ncbi:hypothetical protein, partial [Sphingomonas sp. Leaf208]|uniref:hypothetical protein n=1 Tax=Sphingomonas sp. Leaf208 TaxID=1735679 RepID=UPI001F1CEED4